MPELSERAVLRDEAVPSHRKYSESVMTDLAVSLKHHTTWPYTVRKDKFCYDIVLACHGKISKLSDTCTVVRLPSLTLRD